MLFNGLTVGRNVSMGNIIVYWFYPYLTTISNYSHKYTLTYQNLESYAVIKFFYYISERKFLHFVIDFTEWVYIVHIQKHKYVTDHIVIIPFYLSRIVCQENIS
jgi:hypothetical protein